MNRHEQGLEEKEEFETALAEAKWRYENHGLSASSRAYEYGLLVVKNSFMVAGGGLFFIPAMVGLSADVNLTFAFASGFWFALGVLLALIGNYVIHINWMLHEKVWSQIYQIERIQIRDAFDRGFLDDADDMAKLEASSKRAGFWIDVTFWLPHALVAIYLFALIMAALNLYWAFGIFSEATA